MIPLDDPISGGYGIMHSMSDDSASGFEKMSDLDNFFIFVSFLKQKLTECRFELTVEHFESVLEQKL